MEKTKNGTNVTKALMLGTALVTLNYNDANAQVTFTDVGIMSAAIVAPIVVVQQEPLRFGTYGPTSGTVAIAPDGTPTASAGVLAAPGTALTAPAIRGGILRVTGNTGQNISVTIVGNTVAANAVLAPLMATPSQSDIVVLPTLPATTATTVGTMIVDAFDMDITDADALAIVDAGVARTIQFQIDPAATTPEVDIRVGATLSIGGAGLTQLPGVYQGEYNVVANYP